MINTTLTRSAEPTPERECACTHPNALTCLAEHLHTTRFNAMLLRGHGYRIDYMGAVFLVDASDVLGVIDRAADLARITMNGQVVSHDGCVGYVVSVPGAQLRIHEQNIVEVLP